MATLTIHNVPDRLHARLAARAAAHRRSPDEEALSVLDAALNAGADDLAEPNTRVEAALARIDALRGSMPPVPDEMDPVRIIREARDSGYGRVCL